MTIPEIDWNEKVLHYFDTVDYGSHQISVTIPNEKVITSQNVVKSGDVYLLNIPTNTHLDTHSYLFSFTFTKNGKTVIRHIIITLGYDESAGKEAGRAFVLDISLLDKYDELQ